ncbi:MAG TPA: cupin domain-containing protein [Burkholderiales bacterium]|nr:cupin domain-containing protein [Burkholderiales bacterium]
MSKASTLQRIISPLTMDEFVGAYFQRRPLPLAGREGKFDFLFRAGDFWKNLDQVKQIRAVFARHRQATIRPADIPHMVSAGATICITGMEQAHPKLLQAARRIRAELGYSGEVSFRAYLSAPGSGFDLHYDARVVTTLQIMGSKRWWYSKQPAVPFPTHNSGKEPPGYPRFEPPPPDAFRSVVLKPGHVLCLPAGTWHRAEGRSTSLALNLALDHNHGGSTFDSVMRLLQARLSENPRWREPLPLALRHKAARVPQPVARSLRECIDALQAELAAMRQSEADLTRAWLLATHMRQPL